MLILHRDILDEFKKNNARARKSLDIWLCIAQQADWTCPQDIKNDFSSASICPNDKVVFNIGGNKFRLIVVAVYAFGTLKIDWIGTHAEYDKICPIE